MENNIKESQNQQNHVSPEPTLIEYNKTLKNQLEEIKQSKMNLELLLQEQEIHHQNTLEQLFESKKNFSQLVFQHNSLKVAYDSIQKLHEENSFHHQKILKLYQSLLGQVPLFEEQISKLQETILSYEQNSIFSRSFLGFLFILFYFILFYFILFIYYLF